MGAADEQIRVSPAVKRELEQRKREGESYNDVLERLIGGDRDVLAGFGRWSDETAELARDARERYKEKSKERSRRRE